MTKEYSRREAFGLGARLAGAGTALALGGFSGTQPAYAATTDEGVCLVEPSFLLHLVAKEGYQSYFSMSHGGMVRGPHGTKDSFNQRLEHTSLAVQLQAGDSAGTFTVDERTTSRYNGRTSSSIVRQNSLEVNGRFKALGHDISFTIEQMLQEDGESQLRVRNSSLYEIDMLSYNGHRVPLDFRGRADPTSPVYKALDLVSDLDRAARKGSLKIVKDEREALLPIVEAKKEEGDKK